MTLSEGKQFRELTEELKPYLFNASYLDYIEEYGPGATIYDEDREKVEAAYARAKKAFDEAAKAMDEISNMIRDMYD
jgi:hypothetical protein